MWGSLRAKPYSKHFPGRSAFNPQLSHERRVTMPSGHRGEHWSVEGLCHVLQNTPRVRFGTEAGALETGLSGPDFRSQAIGSENSLWSDLAGCQVTDVSLPTFFSVHIHVHALMLLHHALRPDDTDSLHGLPALCHSP